MKQADDDGKWGKKSEAKKFVALTTTENCPAR